MVSYVISYLLQGNLVESESSLYYTQSFCEYCKYKYYLYLNLLRFDILA